MTAVTDPLGHKTSTGYDGDGRATTVTDALGNKTTVYDADGRPVNLIDADSNKTTFAYRSFAATKGESGKGQCLAMAV